MGGRSIVEFFFTDTYGPMAQLRNQFKQVAGIPYDDARFFEAVAARVRRGSVSARVDKDG
jgi:hypothetical protein